MADKIHQELFYDAEPKGVFRLLTEQESFAALSGGAPTTIDSTPGGEFSCFGGMILGRTLECLPEQRLVQAWRVKTWEPGLYSVVRFVLEPHNAGTKVTMDHVGFPEGQGEHLGQGWHANYWEPMRAALAK